MVRHCHIHRYRTASGVEYDEVHHLPGYLRRRLKRGERGGPPAPEPRDRVIARHGRLIEIPREQDTPTRRTLIQRGATT